MNTALVRRHATSLGLALVAATPLAAQTARLVTNAPPPVPPSELLDRTARLNVRDVSLLDALRELEKRSGVPLAYSPSLLPARAAVSCDCDRATLREALEAILGDVAFTFRELRGQVLVLPDSAKATREIERGAIGLISPAESSPRPLALAPRPFVDSAIVSGRVATEAGIPISSAIVTIPRLRLSTTTNDAGLYRLIVTPDRFVARAETLHVTRLGFRPVNVPFSLSTGRLTVDAVMASQAVSLDQVVVTGTAGNQERRAQAAVVASIDAADVMAKAPVLDVNELLYARTAGLSMTKASGTSGANTRIDIRGQASVSLSNYPLIFIDGVRVSAGPRSVAQAPGGTTSGAGGQQFNALNDLNPDDIENIEIVKGPAAATLYGADASAGVIQILTKRGRAGARRFNQKLTTEYDGIDPNFSPATNYAKCTTASIAPTSTSALCRGQTVGTVVHDNPLERIGAFRNGSSGSLQYSAQGGGENFGYYASFSGDDEHGTTLGSLLNHRTGRANANWMATPNLGFDVSLGFSRADDKLTQGDQSSYGYLINGGFGSALSVNTGADGKLTGGLLNNNLSVAAISAIKTEDLSIRSTPSVQMRYSPFSWFSNRLTLGGDMVRTTATQMYPKNDRNWYSAIANTGSVTVNENNNTIYTVDYLGNINKRFFTDGWLSSDLSFGSQWINTTQTAVGASGQGLLTNSNNLVGAATTTTAAQGYGQSKSFGFFGQEQIGFHDKLYLQLGARVDRNSAFGSQVGSFFLPKAGISYVMSQEGFWQGLSSVIPTFRVRAAYGTTGRSPSGTASLQTYSRANYITDLGLVQPGVAPGSPGNANLKPERGTEIEAGFDAGFFHDRAGIELTYFNKTSKDLLLTQPLAPSSGFSSAPLINVGEVSNKGVEVSLRATPIDTRRVSWDASLNFATLSNEIVSMGNITPFVSSNNQCFKPGVQIAAWCVPRVISVDTLAKKAIVSDTAQVVGGLLPKYSGSVTSSITLFRNLRVYALFDGKLKYKTYNLARDFRDRSLANSAEANLPAGQGGYSTYERIRRFGPFVTRSSGAAVGTALVRDPYVVDGDFLRFRELSVTFTLPTMLTNRFGRTLSGASISVGGRNLALWTKYDGVDPEVVGVVDQGTPYLADVFTLPQVRRTFARLNIQF